VAEAARSTANQCAGTRRDGEPCAAPVTGDSGYCFAHDPGRAEERNEARRRGGENRSNAARLHGLVPPRLVGTYDTLERALEEVHKGGLDPKQAQAMASLARAMVAVLTAGELEQRVRDLESRVSN
jgi:hypothetical protein